MKRPGHPLRLSYHSKRIRRIIFKETDMWITLIILFVLAVIAVIKIPAPNSPKDAVTEIVLILFFFAIVYYFLWQAGWRI
jgi:hypothetical protein